MGEAMKALPVIVLVLLAISFSVTEPDKWRNQIWMMYLGITLWLTYYTSKRFTFIGAALLLVVFINATYTGYWPWGQYFVMGGKAVLFTRMVGANTLAFMAILLLPAFLLPTRILGDITKAFSILCLISSTILIATQIFRLTDHPMGILGQHSVDSAFIACMFPFVFHYFYKGLRSFTSILIFLPITATLLADSTTGFMAIGVSLIAYNFAWRPSLKSFPAFAIIAGLLTLTAGYLVEGSQMFNSTYRFEVWKIVMDYFYHDVNWFYGAGMGLFEVLGPSIQTKYNLTDVGGFIFLHNDWLQILFELGVGAFILCVLLFFESLYRSFERPYLFSAIATYGFVMLTQMPFRYGLWAAFGVLLLRISFDRRKNKFGRTYP